MHLVYLLSEKAEISPAGSPAEADFNSAPAPPVVVVSQVVPEEFTPALQDRTSADFRRLEEVACAQVGVRFTEAGGRIILTVFTEMATNTQTCCINNLFSQLDLESNSDLQKLFVSCRALSVR